jgi:hypothetical protein
MIKGYKIRDKSRTSNKLDFLNYCREKYGLGEKDTVPFLLWH